jgi:hypothetical protein
MACIKPATGARASHFYAAEIDCGVTPANAAFKPLRFTSGNPQQTRDSLQSEELDGSREIADLRLGSKQTGGEINVELSVTSYDDLLEAALGGSWSSGLDISGLDVSVDSASKVFTRASGDNISDGIEVGQILQYSGFSEEENNQAFIVTDVTALTVTGAYIKDGKLVDESSATVNYKTADGLEVGTSGRSFTILTHFADAEDGVNGAGTGIWQITRGVVITGFSFDVSVNSIVTGSFPTLGRGQETDILLEGGWTFPAVEKTETFAGVDGKLIEAGAVIAFVTSIQNTLDNNAQALFEIGSDEVSFIEEGRANSTLSIATYFTNANLVNKFLNETETSIDILLTGVDGSLSFSYPRVVYTSGAPSIEGQQSVSQALEAQALGQQDGGSSLIIQRLPSS